MNAVILRPGEACAEPCIAKSGASSGRRRMRSPYAAFSKTVIQGKMDSPWKTSELPGLVGSLRSTLTSPSVGVSSPARMRSSVVFPQPLGPTIVKNSPAAISPDRDRVATFRP